MSRAAEVLPGQGRTWLVYCRTGRRSADAVRSWMRWAIPISMIWAASSAGPMKSKGTLRGIFNVTERRRRAPVRGAERFFAGLSSLLRAKREPEKHHARGGVPFVNAMSKENQKTTSDFDALDPRERGCSPLSDPEGSRSPKKLAASLNAFFSLLRFTAPPMVLRFRRTLRSAKA